MRRLSALFLLVALAAGTAFWLQREAAAALRDDLALLSGDRRELVRLREENSRLAAALPPAETIAALRADREAVGRLRHEIEKTRASVQTRERALAVPPAGASAAYAAPVLVTTVGVGLDGRLTSHGQAFDPAMLRQQLLGFPRGSAFELRVQLPKAENGVPFDQVKQGLATVATQAKEIAREFGLTMNLRTEPALP